MALKRKTLIVAGVGAGVALAALAVWRLWPPPAMAVVEISPRPVERVLSVVGRLRPVTLVPVMSTNPGQVVRILHNDGDIVAAGEPLAVVRADVERTQAEADRSRAGSALAAADVARRDFARLHSLRGTGAVSEMAQDEARGTMQTTRADADAAVATARASATRAREFTIRAPMAGVVLSRGIDNGQAVSTTTTLFELGSLRGVEIRADVDEAYADALRPGMTARVALTGSKESFPARVSEVSPEVNTSTGGRLVKLTPAPAAGVAPGRSVDVTILVDRQSNAIVLPRQAIVNATTAPTVYVVDSGGVLRVRPVTVANWPSLNAIIQTGLRPGERVIAAPAGARPGARVRPVSSPPATGA